MAKKKVYFWLKVDKKFFENVFIKRLKSVPGGYTMTVIYIRLMLESLESDCILYYEGYFKNLVEELALKLDVSEDDISMTLNYFVRCGLIQIDEEGNAEIPQAKALVESETNYAQYMRQYRKNKELDYNVNPPLTTCKQEIEIEIEIEKEIELDIKKEIEVEEKKTTADFNVYDYYQHRIGVIDSFQYTKLKEFIEIDGLDHELVKIAIDKAADNSKRSFGYINNILKNWAQNGIKTVTQQQEEQRRFEENKNFKEKGYYEPDKTINPDFGF